MPVWAQPVAANHQKNSRIPAQLGALESSARTSGIDDPRHKPQARLREAGAFVGRTASMLKMATAANAAGQFTGNEVDALFVAPGAPRCFFAGLRFTC